MPRVQIYRNNLMQVKNFFTSDRYKNLFNNEENIETLLNEMFSFNSKEKQQEWDNIFQNYLKYRDAYLQGDLKEKQNYENAVIALEEQFQERMNIIRAFLNKKLQESTFGQEVTTTPNRLVYLLIQKQKGEITAQFQLAQDVLNQDMKDAERQFLLRSSDVLKAQDKQNELKSQTLKTEKYLIFDHNQNELFGEDVITGIQRVIQNFSNGTNIVMNDGSVLGMNSTFSNINGKQAKISEARMIDILFSGTRLELFKKELQNSEYNGLSLDERIQKAQSAIITNIQGEYERDLTQYGNSRDAVLQRWSSENIMGILQGDAYDYMAGGYSNEIQIKTQGFGKKGSRSIDFIKTNGLETAYLLFSQPSLLKGLLVGSPEQQEAVLEQLSGILETQAIEEANTEGTASNQSLQDQIQQLFDEIFGSS